MSKIKNIKKSPLDDIIYDLQNKKKYNIKNLNNRICKFLMLFDSDIMNDFLNLYSDFNNMLYVISKEYKWFKVDILNKMSINDILIYYAEIQNEIINNIIEQEQINEIYEKKIK